ncbi:MAG: rRNA pseudouridine synthase [Butyrivibrio sp.]|nr:rRNA pseudouridine synthase [Acetatifactor muris]MCM1559448.1 rRNA pseudouridine synthase [Butyrivibrio sp.]
MRLNKYLAHAGICSRREADRLIEQGRVLVNGQQSEPGQQVSGQDEITVNGKKVQGTERKVVLAFYKPVGVTCTEKDAHAEKIIGDLVKYPVRVTYAGRLDRDSEGLLLLTNDGDLIQGMMRGANRHEKEYIVRVDKEITPDFLKKMEAGIYLKDLKIKTRECRLEQIGKYTFKIILTQGVNRQIRRMCAACGWRTKEIKRIRVMSITLGSLKPGEFRELSGQEIEGLYRECARNEVT